MLREFANVRQNEKESWRRWFESKNFDLIVWYDLDKTTIKGFQLCYKKDFWETALTWKRKGGYSVNQDFVDTGETIPTEYKKSPILIPGGVFDKEDVIALFKQESAQLEEWLATFVLKKLQEY